MSFATIQVGMHVIGEITLNDNQVRGEGGPYNPRLVVPVEITLHQRPATQAIAVTSLTHTFYCGEIGPSTQIGQPVTRDLTAGFPARSNPHGPSRSYLEMQFHVSEAMIVQMEAHRHRSPDTTFQGWVTVSASVAWILAAGGEAAGEQSLNPIPDYSFDMTTGVCVSMAPFMETRVDNLSIRLPASTWVDKVLPGLGLDQLRLVEIALPRSGGVVPGEVIPHFDAARRDYDSGRHRECIQKCRDVRTLIEKHLGASKGHPVGDAMADLAGLPLPQDQRRFLNQCWIALVDLTSAAHHQVVYSTADARACLLLTAVLLEYLQMLLAAPPLGYGARTMP